MIFFTTRFLKIGYINYGFQRTAIVALSLLLLFIFSSKTLFAQTAITTQTGNIDVTRIQNTSGNSFAGAFNFTPAEFANFANQKSGSNTTPGVASFRTFTTNQVATGGTARALRSGDRFIITAFANTPATTGIIGISFKNNTTYTNVSDYNNGEVCRFELTSGGFWTIVHGAGTITTAAPFNADGVLQLDITSSNTFNATINGVTYYNLGFINPGPVASFSIYNIVTVAAVDRSNPDSYWKTASLQGRPIVFGGTANVTVTGNITNGGGENTTALSPTNVSFTGSNIITLNPGVGNTYTGTTTISSGTVRLGAANALPPTNINISNNATLRTGAAAGFNQTLGVLTMTTGATIALGTGAHALNFTASNAASWSGTLTISGWNPIASGQVFFGNSAAGLTAGQLAQINFTGFGTGAKILSTGEIVPANFYISTQTGLYNTAATWLGGVVPPTGAFVYINNGHNVTLDGGNSLSRLNIFAGGTFTASDASPRILTISNSASATAIANSGTWANGAGGSTVLFTSTGPNLVHTITGTIAFNNVSIIRTAGLPDIGITFSATSTINNNFTLNAGGYVQTTAPTYGASSTLIYNSGNVYNISSEWTPGVTSGAGYPNNVQIGSSVNSSALSIAAGIYHCAGSFTFSATISGAALTIATATVNIGGDWINNATPAAANFTMGTGTVGFTGAGIRTIGGTNTNAGSYAFYNLTVNKTGGSVALNRAISIANNLTVNGSGTFSLNAFSLNVASIIGSSTAAVINNSSAVTNVTLTVTNGNGNTFSGSLQNGGAATLTFVKQGIGTQTLSGTASSYSGTTTVAGGTLDIGGAGAMSSASNYIFNGGNLSVNSTLPAASSLSAGTLNIQANTSFNLGVAAAAFSINFAASNLVGWNGASTLTIFNWTPSAGKIINVATGTGLTAAQLGNVNINNYGVGSKIVGIEVRPAFLYVTQAAGSGDYTVAASWLLGDRPVLNNGTESIFIQSGFSLNMDVAAPTVNVLRAEVAGTLTMGNADIINIYATGDFRVNGTINMNISSVINLANTTNFQIGGTVNMTSSSVINFTPNISLIATSATANFSSAGTLNFAGAFTITSNAPNAVLLPNVNLTAGVDFGQNSTIRSGSSLFMLPGGFVNTNPPFYATGSNLVYNTGGPYSRGTEWNSISGRGYPANVRIGTTTNFRLSNGTPGTVRQMSGNLTINAGRIFTLEDGAGMNVALTVAGDVNVNGALRLGNAIGGDIRVGGNYTVAAAGSVFNNNRAVVFIGNGDQFVTKTGGGTIFFDFIVVNKPSGNVRMTLNTNAHIISQVNNDLSLRVLQLLNGDIDMNGGVITLQGDNINSLNIFVDGGSTRKIFTSTGTGEFRITGSNATGVAKLSVSAGSAGSRLLFDNNVLVTTDVGVNFGVAGITTINAQLRIDQNGYVITNAPDYGPASTLIYNNGAGGYKRNMEWNTNTAGATGAGYPNNVVVQNNTPVDLNSTDFPTIFPLGCSGKMRIAAGSSIITGTMAHTLSIGDTLAIDGTLTLSTNAAGDLNVGGGWLRTGTFVQNDRMVTFDSTNNAFIRATGGQNFSRMTINKKTAVAAISVDSSITITNELFLQRGAVTLNNTVTLISDNTRTARIGETTVPANVSIAYGAGNFVVQRHLPIANTAAARRWRMLTAPFKSNNAPTINAAWQEGQSSANRLLPSNTVAGFGTAITRSNTAANGYDQGLTNNPSIYSYNSATNGWDPLAATNAGKITDRPGYMVFVRGDRSIIVSSTGVPGTPTTLRASGEINIGAVTTALNGSGFQVLGNPYASAISFNNVLFNGVNPGTTAGSSFYLWDPKLPGLSNVGGWITCTSLGTGLYAVTANGSGYPTDGTFTGIIESGAAIMVPAAGGNFSFREACKIAPSSTVGIASRPVVDDAAINEIDFLTCNLLSGTTAKIVDGVINIGRDDFERAVNEKDAPKLVSFASTERISILREQQKLSIELNNKISAGDTIFYHLSKLVQADYQLAFIGKGINKGLVGFVQDKFTGISTLVNVNDSVYIPFRVTADSASAAADRFRIVFSAAVGYNNVQATAVNNDIVVEWNVSSEFNLLQYEIERSTDGINFMGIGNHLSNGNSNTAVQYKWTDISPGPGKYVYRIKAVTNQAAVIHSNIVRVEIYKSSSSMYVFPNPITNGTIGLYMNKQPQGVYQAQLYNTAGQAIFSQLFSHSAAAAIQKITPDRYLAKGIYHLKITAEGQPEVILKVVVQ